MKIHRLALQLMVMSMSFSIGVYDLWGEETPVTLKNIGSVDLERYKSPKLLDGQVVSEKVRQLQAGLEALIHMSEMITEEHARKAMKAQIDSIKATLESLETQVKTGPLIDYDFPAPLPVSKGRETQNQQRRTKSKVSPATTRTPQAQISGEVKAMSATELSQFWGAIERASFHNDKMAVIRQVNRDQYLTTQQAELLIEALTFSKDRRDAVKLLYPKLVDPDRIETLYQLLDQPTHRREVKREVEQVNMGRRLKRAQGGRSGY